MRKLLLLLLPLIGFGQVDPDAVFLGGTEVEKIYLYDEVVYESLSVDVTNLIAYYTLDSNGNDIVGTYNGTVTNGTFSTGKVGNGFEGDGNQDGITIADNNVFTHSNGTTDSAFSYDGWFKFNSVPQEAWFISKRDANGVETQFNYFGNAIGFSLYDNTNVAAANTGNFIQISYSWTPTVGVWYHLAATYDGSGSASGLSIYIDGVSFGTTSSGGTYTAMQNTTGDVYIGIFGLQPTSTTRAFDGVSDEVKIWDEELTPSKIADIIAIGNNGNQITN